MSVAGAILPFNPSQPPGEARNPAFYRISAAPGSVAEVSLDGQHSGGATLLDPLVGVFSATGGACALRTYADYGGTGYDPGLTVAVDSSGELLIAATACCDFDFSGQVFEGGRDYCFGAQTISGTFCGYKSADGTFRKLSPEQAHQLMLRMRGAPANVRSHS